MAADMLDWREVLALVLGSYPSWVHEKFVDADATQVEAVIEAKWWYTRVQSTREILFPSLGHLSYE